MRMVSLGAQALLTSESCYDSCWVFTGLEGKPLSDTGFSQRGIPCSYTSDAWHSCCFWDPKVSRPKVRQQWLTSALPLQLGIALDHRCSWCATTYSACAGDHIDIAGYCIDIAKNRALTHSSFQHHVLTTVTRNENQLTPWTPPTNQYEAGTAPGNAALSGIFWWEPTQADSCFHPQSLQFLTGLWRSPPTA